VQDRKSDKSQVLTDKESVTSDKREGSEWKALKINYSNIVIG